jgi:hypothetical protein
MWWIGGNEVLDAPGVVAAVVVADVVGWAADEEAETVTVRCAWVVTAAAEPPAPPPARPPLEEPPPAEGLTAAIRVGAGGRDGERATTIVLARLVTPPGVVAAPITLPTPSMSRIETAAALASGMRSPTRSAAAGTGTAATVGPAIGRRRSARSCRAAAIRAGNAARRAPQTTQ